MKEIKRIHTKTYRSNIVVSIELQDDDPNREWYYKGFDVYICADDIGVERYASPEEWAAEKAQELTDALAEDGYTVDEDELQRYKLTLEIAVDHLMGWGKELDDED